MEERVSALEATVRAHDVRIDDVERETLRIRDRVHELHDDRATLLAGGELTRMLAEQVKQLAGGIDAITVAAFVAQHFHFHIA